MVEEPNGGYVASFHADRDRFGGPSPDAPNTDLPGRPLRASSERIESPASAKGGPT